MERAEEEPLLGKEGVERGIRRRVEAGAITFFGKGGRRESRVCGWGGLDAVGIGSSGGC